MILAGSQKAGGTGGEVRRHTLLHLGDELLVEHATGLLVQRAVDGDDVALGEHVLEIVDAAAANLLLLLVGQGLVVVVEQLGAVEGLEAAQDALANAADGDGADDLALEVVLLLGGGGHVPVAALHHLVGGHEVADQHQDGHDHVLGHRHHVGARHLSHRDAAVGLVSCVEVHVVRPDTRRHRQLEVLGLGEALGRQVARVEAVEGGKKREVVSMGLESLSGVALHQGLDDARATLYVGAGRSTHGVVMMISASTSSWSNLEFSPSLSEVVTRV